MLSTRADARPAQLWSVGHTAEVLLLLGERPDVIDCLQAAASAPFAADATNAAALAAALAAPPPGGVVQLPCNLPEPPESYAAWSEAPYGLSAAAWASPELAASWQARAAAPWSSPGAACTC